MLTARDIKDEICYLEDKAFQLLAYKKNSYDVPTFYEQIFMEQLEKAYFHLLTAYRASKRNKHSPMGALV